MKTFYALIFVLLSSPVIADVLDITPTGADEDNTATISTSAPQPIEHAVDFYVDDDNAEPIPTPAIKPVDVAEVQVASRGDDTTIEEEAHTAAIAVPAASQIEEEAHTATVAVPAASQIEDEPIEVEVDLSVDETGFDWE
jgi:hypothetical protein